MEHSLGDSKPFVFLSAFYQDPSDLCLVTLRSGSRRPIPAPSRPASLVCQMARVDTAPKDVLCAVWTAGP